MRFLVIAVVLMGGATAGAAWQQGYGWKDLRAGVRCCGNGTSATNASRWPTPTPNLVPSADRTSCDEIRSTDYRSPSERTWFLAQCITPVATTEPVAIQESASPTPDCTAITQSLPHYQWPVECVEASWLPFACDTLRYRVRGDSAPPSGWREWYIANCNPSPRDETGLPPPRVPSDPHQCWTTLQPFPAVVTTRLILRGEVITSDAVTMGESPDCPNTEGWNERQLEAVVGTRALADIGPKQLVDLGNHCESIDDPYGVSC